MHTFLISLPLQVEPNFYFLLSWKDEFPWGYCLPDRPDVSLAVGSDDFEKQLHGSIDAKHSSRGNYGNKRRKQSALKQAAGKHCLGEMWGRVAAPGAMSSLGSHLDSTGPLTNTESEAQSCLWTQPEPKSGAKPVLQLFLNFPKAPFPADIVFSREQIIINRVFSKKKK